MITLQPFDLAVVGAGIVGLAHALAAARAGQRVVVIDRDAQANGASIRNFGYITVTGQAGHAHEIQVTRDFITWITISTVNLDVSGSAEFVDPTAALVVKRFYRVRDTQP